MTPDELIASFTRPARSALAPRLLVVGGLPASGKSTLARALLSDSGHVAHVEADALRMTLTGGVAKYTPEEHAMVHGTVITLSCRLLAEGYAVISDATNLRRRERRFYLAAAEGIAATAVAWCSVDEATARERLARRAARADASDVSQADIEVWLRMNGRGSLPDASEADLISLVSPQNLPVEVERLRAFLAGAPLASVVS